MSDTATVGWVKFAGMRVLLLQGPHGRFFQRVARALSQAGVTQVEKIDFCGGDRLFSLPHAHVYRGTMQDWPEYLSAFLDKHQIDCIMVFGDCRPVHLTARQLAHSKGLQFWAFEEGYVRPNFITFEPHGVNGHSRLPNDRASYESWEPIPLPVEMHVPPSFWNATGYAIAYFAATILLRWYFPNYQHHRPVRVMDGIYWLRAMVRKWHYRWKEKNVLTDLKGFGGQSPYFLCALQVALDAQVRSHSTYESIEQFIQEVIHSFADHAPADTVLLIKHHPMDRGYTDYSFFIERLANQLSLHKRVRYIHDQHLPTLMAHAQGLVTINSTVGLSAMHHSLPVKLLGQAVYDIPGLVSSRTLHQFWSQAQLDRPDSKLYKKFVNYVIVHTQINGNFYRELSAADAAGVHYFNLPLMPCLGHKS